MTSMVRLTAVVLGTLIAVNHIRKRFPQLDALTAGGGS